MIGKKTLVGTYYATMNGFLQWAREKTEWHPLRIPTKPATNSNRKPATDSDPKPATVPI
jgi:hypothetical protein